MPRVVASSARWLGAHEGASAALLFALFVLAYLWPVLIGGDVLSPRAVLFEYAPWRAGAPPDWQASANLLLGDVPMSHYPFHVLVRDFIREGTFPAWSQHAYAGVPFFANPQTLILSPFALPIWVLPLELGIGVSAALKLWVAAFGTYLLVRELRLGFWPAVLAGISFALSAFGVVWLTHETLLAVAAILPWAIWLVERIVRTGAFGPAVGLIAAGVMIVTGGHPGTQVHVIVAIGLYALVRGALVVGVPRGERVRRLALALGGVAIGLLIMAVLIVPVLKASSGTIGIEARIGENDTIPGADLPFGAIRTALFPDWWGRPDSQTIGLGPANYNERTFYAGAVATLFGLIALVGAGGWRRKAPFAVLGFVGLAVPLHVPGLLFLATHLPLLRQVQFQRIMLLYVFAMAVLAAFGLQRVLDAPRQRRRPGAVLAAAGGVGLIALLAASVGGDDLGRGLSNAVRARHAVGPDLANTVPNVGELVATTVGRWLLLTALVGAGLAALWRWPRRRSPIVVAIVVLAAVDLLTFAHGYQPMQPAEQVTPPRTPAIAYLQRHAAEGRFVGLGGTLLADWPSIYGLRDVRGAEPPQPSLRWFHLWKGLVYPDQLDWAQLLLIQPPTETGMRALSVLGTRYVVTPPVEDLSASLPRLRPVHRGSDAIVLLNPDAVPRAMVARRVVLSDGEQGTLSTIAELEFRPREQVVVERTEPGAAALAGISGEGGRVEVTDETDTSVTLAATLRRRGLVVLDDSLEQGWSVRVDGRPADAVRVDDVMRGVAVPAGRHEITWSYAVPGLGLGLALSAVGLLALLGACAVLRRSRRPRAPASR